MKICFFLTDSGYPLEYVVSPASFHDIRMVSTLAQNSMVSHIIGDKGYLSNSVKELLSEKRITITTPLRKNMISASKVEDRLLGKRRKRMETVFSSLELLGIETFMSRSLLSNLLS
ncbi:hypothetical protein IGI37_000531 [Enterococcus sp. AZ194]|uniref:transposase n=1 Tax=Enterococcus sp. AZ194 TaxID=2774629 RepID=UPI003F219078